MSGPSFGLPTEMSGGGARLGKYRRLLVTESRTLDDPSGGRAEEFRVTMVGGGGGGKAGNSAAGGGGGGGAEGYSFMVRRAYFAWPVDVYVGAGGAAGGSLGGSTGFGGVFVAGGGTVNYGNTYFYMGGGSTSLRNQCQVTHNGAITGGQAAQAGMGGLAGRQGSMILGADGSLWSSGAGGASATYSTNGDAGGPCGGQPGGKIAVGGGPGSPCCGGGASIMGAGGSAPGGPDSAPPGFGGGGGSSLTAADPGGGGAVLIEWYE